MRSRRRRRLDARNDFSLSLSLRDFSLLYNIIYVCSLRSGEKERERETDAFSERASTPDVYATNLSSKSVFHKRRNSSEKKTVLYIQKALKEVGIIVLYDRNHVKILRKQEKQRVPGISN